MCIRMCHITGCPLNREAAKQATIAIVFMFMFMGMLVIKQDVYLLIVSVPAGPLQYMCIVLYFLEVERVSTDFDSTADVFTKSDSIELNNLSFLV